jgi:hypothetical protein
VSGKWVIVCTGYDAGARRPPIVPEGQLLEDLMLGGKFGTCWTFDPGRAMRFVSQEAAEQAWNATGPHGSRPGAGLRVEYRQERN